MKKYYDDNIHYMRDKVDYFEETNENIQNKVKEF